VPRRQIDFPDQLTLGRVARINDWTMATGHVFGNEHLRLLDSGEDVAVLALGDSWFHYPFNHLMTPLQSALEVRRST
jgi:precorrin-2 methylase